MDEEELIRVLKEFGTTLIDYYFERMLGKRPEKKLEATTFVEESITKPKTFTKVPDGTPKIDTNRIFNYMSKKGTPYTCNDFGDFKGCGNFLSWDLRPGRKMPLHVNQDGKILGNGNCPNR